MHRFIRCRYTCPSYCCDHACISERGHAEAHLWVDGDGDGDGIRAEDSAGNGQDDSDDDADVHGRDCHFLFSHRYIVPCKGAACERGAVVCTLPSSARDCSPWDEAGGYLGDGSVNERPRIYRDSMGMRLGVGIRG
jgi:hypothetical protein